MENVSNINISDCVFRRLDGNAVFLSRRTRNVTIEESIFEWLGENAVATWGDTDHYDATAENFPMFTTIQRNVFREVGIYQKQSSAVGQCKAALTTIRDNIMFNMPRAAINFNDMVGGGDVVEGNVSTTLGWIIMSSDFKHIPKSFFTSAFSSYSTRAGRVVTMVVSKPCLLLTLLYCYSLFLTFLQRHLL
jgi:hypothetical protein